MTPWTTATEERLMTKPRDLTHRPGCPQSGTKTERVGSWQLERCVDCRATGLRRTQTTDKETRP